MRFIGLASTMVIARLLTPDEIGTYAIAGAIVMIMIEFRMLGAGNYLIRENELTENKIREALGLTILISWGLGLIILLSAIPVSEFYGLPPLAGIFAILSSSFFIAPYISIPTALLSRELAFKVQFQIRLTSSLINAFSTIGFIVLGFSYYSLAIGQTLTAVVQFVMLLWINPQGMAYMPRFRNLRVIARFGIFNSLATLIRRGSVTAPDMIIGKLGTTFQVGMFSRGLGFVEFVSQTIVMGIQPVALPYLSKTRREGGAVSEAYLKASVMLGAFVAPVLGVASLASLPAIRLFFGNQWDAAAPFASWLALWAMFRCAHWFSQDALMAVGREGLMLVKEIIPFVVLVPGIVLAYPHGLEAISQVFVLVGFIDFIVTMVVLKWSIGLSPSTFLKGWSSNLVNVAICMGVTWGIGRFVSFEESPWKPFVALACVMPLVWLTVLFVSKNPLAAEIADIVRKRLHRKHRISS